MWYVKILLDGEKTQKILLIMTDNVLQTVRDGHLAGIVKPNDDIQDMILLQQGSQKCSTHERLSKHRTSYTEGHKRPGNFPPVFLQKNHLTLDKERKKGLMIH